MQLYIDLASSYNSANISELETFVNTNQEKFEAVSFPFPLKKDVKPDKWIK